MARQPQLKCGDQQCSSNRRPSSGGSTERGAQHAALGQCSHPSARAGIDVVVAVVTQRNRQPLRLLLPAPAAKGGQASERRWAAAGGSGGGWEGPSGSERSTACNRIYTCRPDAMDAIPAGEGAPARHDGGSSWRLANPKRAPQAGKSACPRTHPWSSSVCTAAPVCRRLPPRASRLVAARRNILMGAPVITGLTQLQKAGIPCPAQPSLAPAERPAVGLCSALLACWMRLLDSAKTLQSCGAVRERSRAPGAPHSTCSAPSGAMEDTSRRVVIRVCVLACSEAIQSALAAPVGSTAAAAAAANLARHQQCPTQNCAHPLHPAGLCCCRRACLGCRAAWSRCLRRSRR